MKIGSVELATPVLLSPIAGYTDLPYRLIVRAAGGLGMAYTELVNPAGIKRHSTRTMELVETNQADSPLAIQLYGWDADELAQGCRWAADHGSVLVDINMGCPVPKVAGKGGGSGLLKACDNAVRIAEACVNACPVPVTVKTRLGWNHGDLVTPKLARQLENIGVQALTIHGRYGAQKFTGSVSLDGIAAVVAAVDKIPVFGNGDIKSVADAKHMVAVTNCAGVMIGRWALADPWLIRDVAAALQGQPTPPTVDRRERVLTIIRHFELMREIKGDDQAIVDFRRRMPWYCKTVGPCPDLRREMPRLKTVIEFYDRINRFLDEIDAGTAFYWHCDPNHPSRRESNHASPADDSSDDIAESAAEGIDHRPSQQSAVLGAGATIE